MANDILIEAGKTIISSFFDRNEKDSMDDTELLPLVKDVVIGMSTHSTDVEAVREVLFRFAQKKYTDMCYKDPDEDDDVQLQENKEYFEYVYENEEHPH